MKSLPIEKIQPHPDNPRLVMREDVIESIVAGMSDGFHESYALQVYPNGDSSFYVLSGHHRLEAAKRKGLSEVPCFIRQDLDEEGAYMVLATANAQGELSPLEIGMHALRYVSKSKGGRGNKGGLSGYAEKVGRHKDTVSTLRMAATVYEKLSDRPDGLLDKAAHLAAIHKLPEECWGEAVAHILKEGISAKDTQSKVAESLEMSTVKRQAAVFCGRTTKRELSRIDDIRDRVASTLEYDRTRDEWLDWHKDNDPVDVKVVQQKRVEIEEKEAERRESESGSTEQEHSVPNLVLADPPWRYEFAETDNRQIENQYPSATVEEIIDMKPDTQSDAVCFMWATVAKLPEALEVLKSWGFEYKTSAVWDKEKIGMGYWFRGQHELLLVGTKGKFSPPESDHRVSSVFRESRSKHSKKPVCVYEWIESAFPDSIKLEMYCRQPRDGWAAWGNEV